MAGAKKSMRKTVGAVQYGIETLGISPDALFNLISSSKGYDGDVYERWLAARIIDVAEAEGVGFSQLLVKKFNILSELSEDADGGIKEEYLGLIEKELGQGLGNLYTLGLDGIDVFYENKKMSWGNFMSNIDYDSVNSFFVDSFKEEFNDDCLCGGEYPFLFRFGMDPSDKKSDLYVDAKSRGLGLKYLGSEVLYRMCLLEGIHGCVGRFGILCPTAFLYDEENKGIINEFLMHFKVYGYAISDLSMFSGEMAFCVCEKNEGHDLYPQIWLKKTKLVSGKVSVDEGKKLYTRSSKPMWNYLLETSPAMDDVVVAQRDGKFAGTEKGNKKALGYLYRGSELWVQRNPEKDSPYCIPITAENLIPIIAYMGVFVSNVGNGYFSDVGILLSGHENYNSLVYNCLPLFLFDRGMRCAGVSYEVDGVQKYRKNKLDPVNSEIVKSLYDVGEVFFSFEAKELWNLGMLVLERVPVEKRMTMTFWETLTYLNDSEITRRYVLAVQNLKGYIISAYSDLYEG